jgi:hypothetical protein
MPFAIQPARTCLLCGCTDDRPCLGGEAYLRCAVGGWVRRIITDTSLLAPGAACRWVARIGGGWICSAHTVSEAEKVAAVLDPEKSELWG